MLKKTILSNMRDANFDTKKRYSTLLLRIRNGDATAENELVNEFYASTFGKIKRKVQNTVVAEDLVHDTLIIVIQKARENTINNPAALARFISQTAFNLLIDYYRREMRRETNLFEDIDRFAPAEEINIERQVNSVQVLSVVVDYIDQLNVARDRQILLDFFIYNKQKSQICQELGLHAEHFDRVLHRAKKRLKILVKSHV